MHGRRRRRRHLVRAHGAARERRRVHALRAAGPALYLAATLCKSVVVPAPAAVAALDATLLARRAGAPRLLRRVAATTARDLAGYAAVAAVVVPVTLRANALGHDPDADVIVLHTGAQRCAKALVTIWFCLGKAAYPAGLSPHYALRDLYFEAGHDDGEARLALACFVATTAGCAALALAGLDGGAALVALGAASAAAPRRALHQPRKVGPRRRERARDRRAEDHAGEGLSFIK